MPNRASAILGIAFAQVRLGHLEVASDAKVESFLLEQPARGLRDVGASARASLRRNREGVRLRADAVPRRGSGPERFRRALSKAAKCSIADGGM